jgi:DNA-binding transcriptional regulator GbsR (MarR family)
MTDAARPLGDDPVAQLVSALAANGFPRIPGSVLMCLMVSEAPSLTAEELAGELGVSAAAISGAVRYLSTLGMVHRHRVPGSRKYVYELPANAWYAASIGKNELYDLAIRLSEKAAPELGPRGRERIEEMAAFFRFLKVRLPELLVEWDELKAAREPN